MTRRAHRSVMSTSLPAITLPNHPPAKQLYLHRLNGVAIGQLAPFDRSLPSPLLAKNLGKAVDEFPHMATESKRPGRQRNTQLTSNICRVLHLGRGGWFQVG